MWRTCFRLFEVSEVEFMKRKLLFCSVAFNAAVGIAFNTALAADPEGTKRWPDFEEVYGIVRSNLTEVAPADLNRSAVQGLLNELRSRVTLMTNAEGSAVSTNLVTRAVVFDDLYCYIRIARVADDLAKQIRSAFAELQKSHRIKGLTLDLRYADGHDYAAAAAAADVFIRDEKPLLNWGASDARSTAKTNAITVPLAILVNQQTAGAAEALAAALREAEAGLVIGSQTAGQAYLFKEFKLSHGQQLRIAAGAIRVGAGRELSKAGLNPDIRINISGEEEKVYFEDPYKVLPRWSGGFSRMATNEVAGIFSTNRGPRRRLNESDLVRMQREGIAPMAAETARETPKAVVNDPALARAIDFLKGLILVQGRH